jgi:hypothetical protein
MIKENAVEMLDRLEVIAWATNPKARQLWKLE